MATTNKLFIQIDNDKIELIGADKEAFLADKKANNVAFELVEAEYEAKKQARANAITKLAEIAGLTKEELASIL